jgi:hypothetical protein
MNGYGKKSKKKTMKRRKISGISKKGIGQMVTQDLLPVTAGYVAGNFLPGLILKNSPQYANYLALGLGALLGASQKGMLAKVGLGMAVKGAAGVVTDLMDGSNVNGLGLLPPGVPSVRISGYGDSAMMDETVESIKVQ